MPGDLHTHTTFSDGSTPADKLPFLAACAGMTHLAISDHDSIRSVRYAYAHPVQNGVHLIPATELTAYDYERAHRVHLLCYWPDDCAALADFSAMMAERRLTAMLQSCKELEAICPQFHTEEALELAKDSGTLFKAQVMRVLWQYGLADGMYNTVYKSLFGLKPVRGRILHTPRYEPVDTVLDVIKASRAVVVLAHPSVYHSMELARELIAAGRLDGVEIDHPRNTPEDRAELTRLAKENGLIVTGGTDYHGINTVTPRPVGAFTTSDEMIARIGEIKSSADTVGGVIEVLAYGVPAGIGTYVESDRRLDAALASAVMGIQAIKGVEIGDGFLEAVRPGSQAHDEMVPGADGRITRLTNRAGGIEGGMSNGQPIRVRAAMKPIPSIPRALRTVDVTDGEAASAINQRSDTTAVPAASVVAEAMVRLILARYALDKFGGDSVAETRRNFEQYVASWPEHMR